MEKFDEALEAVTLKLLYTIYFENHMVVGENIDSQVWKEPFKDELGQAPSYPGTQLQKIHPKLFFSLW